jgi:hypothetical protein
MPNDYFIQYWPFVDIYMAAMQYYLQIHGYFICKYFGDIFLLLNTLIIL